MSGTRKYRILLIEDNPGDSLLFRLALSDAGVDCDIAELNDGGAALEFVRTQTGPPPDLIVLDLNLPKASGKEILAAIRATPVFQPVRVVIWTSSNARTDRTHVENLGVTGYLIKPPELSDLAPLGAAIRGILDRPAP
jgi:CheY-like chemotaxis protein